MFTWRNTLLTGIKIACSNPWVGLRNGAFDSATADLRALNDVRIPASLNGFVLWNAILLVRMLFAYGYSIGQLFVLKGLVPAYEGT